MKEMIIILIVLISNNLLAQDMVTKNLGHNNHDSLDYSIIKKDLKNIEYKKAPENFIESTNPRLINPFGVNLNMGGPSILLSVSFDYFITSSLNIEAGAGILGLFGGIKYHLNGNKDGRNWTPYLGLYVVRISELPDFWGDVTPAQNGLYIPLGIQYISNKGFTFGAEVAGITLKDINGGTNVWGAVKLGYHF